MSVVHGPPCAIRANLIWHSQSVGPAASRAFAQKVPGRAQTATASFSLQVGKSAANRASKAANKKAATAAAEEGSAALSTVFAKGAKALEDLRKVGCGFRDRMDPVLLALAGQVRNLFWGLLWCSLC